MKNAIKRIITLTVTGFILAGFSATLTLGKMEYTKKEGKACTICHVKAGSKELNDVGKCYAKSHTLKDCQAAPSK